MNSSCILGTWTFRLALCGSVTLLTQSMFSQTWQTVDNFQNVSGNGTLVFSDSGAAKGWGLALTPHGTVLAAGQALNSVIPAQEATIFSSSDGGNTWFGPLDSFLEGSNSEYYGIVSDAAGNFYAAAHAEINNIGHWVVRESIDGGTTWTTVDDFVPGGYYAFPTGITADSIGNIYVSGYTSTASSSANIWTVRRGVGTSWTTVDSLAGNGRAIFAHRTAGVFAVGNATVTVTSHGKTATVQAWMVRRSLDGGTTWSTVDRFQGLTYAQASGVGADSQGNLYVAGFASNGSDYWTVRKSSNGGGSWTTVDSLAGGRANACGSNSSGDLFVAGNFYPSGGGIGWQVRKNAAGSGSWLTIDDYQFGGTGSTTEPQAIVSNGGGNVLIAGYGFGGTASASTWLIKMY